MHAEARIQEQVVYLGDDSRNQQLGKREREMQEGRQPIKGACQPSYYYERLELSTPGELWEIVGGGMPHVSQQRERKLGYSSTNSHPSGTPDLSRWLATCAFTARTKPSFRVTGVATCGV